MAVSKVGKKYTIVIPQEVREKTSIREGDRVVWTVKGGQIIIKPVSFTRLAGIVKSSTLTSGKEAAEALEKEIERDVKEAINHY
ncbi:MAG: AbrB/MazE/SpoVT family DNA-binding domain-containing protein [Candidatus Geothermarchaeales archaeon]